MIQYELTKTNKIKLQNLKNNRNKELGYKFIISSLCGYILKKITFKSFNSNDINVTKLSRISFLNGIVISGVSFYYFYKVTNERFLNDIKSLDLDVIKFEESI